VRHPCAERPRWIPNPTGPIKRVKMHDDDRVEKSSSAGRGIMAETEDLEWRVTDAQVPYPEALVEMEARVEAIRRGLAGEMVWLLEHPPLYTRGTSAKPEDLLDARFPVFDPGRG